VPANVLHRHQVPARALIFAMSPLLV